MGQRGKLKQGSVFPDMQSVNYQDRAGSTHSTHASHPGTWRCAAACVDAGCRELHHGWLAVSLRLTHVVIEVGLRHCVQRGLHRDNPCACSGCTAACHC
jgi:hypothetical protein